MARAGVHAMIAALLLLAVTAHAESLGRLDWGGWTVEELSRRVKTGEPADEVTRATRRAVSAANETLSIDAPPVAELQLEHVVFSDPRHRASAAAVRPLLDVYDWALCARVAPAAQAAACQEKALPTALAWALTYKPTGNPINENNLVPLILADDLLASVASPQDRATLVAWVNALAAAGDEFYAHKKPKDGRVHNNWMAWRLLIRAMAAEMSGDAAREKQTKAMVTAFVAENVHDDGATTDFHERDALHYHVYDLLPLVELSLLAPPLVDARTNARIEKGVNFLKPYVLGEKKHVEFAGSKVPFDIERREAGDPEFQNAAWKPDGARPLLRYACARYPSVAAWAGSARDGAYYPMIQSVAALHGRR